MTMLTDEQENTVTQSLFGFGLGYSAQALGRLLTARHWSVGGTVRSPQRAETLRTIGLKAHGFDALDPADIPPNCHWLISAPPDENGCPVFKQFGFHASSAKTITYLSTTGVYGDLHGGWAFEWTPVNPRSVRAERRVLAEEQWASTGQPFRTVRLPGIYGPGRSVFGRLRAGTARAIVKHGQVFSRVHVDDIASGLEAMMLRPDMTGVFHLCDDAPAPPHVVTEYAARLLGLDAPERVDFATADLSDMARSFYAECKRVSNARAKSALGWFPEYPTYKEGLSAVLAEEGHPPL